MDHQFNKITHLNRLPAIPVIANEIIQLVADPASSAKQLAVLIERDPSLSAQIMRYARSAFFGYKGKIESIQDAITRVLGFDIVCNIAFGIASSKAFKVPVGGPVGLASLWHQSLLAATLAQTLSRELRERDIPSGMTYLIALLQHFGLFALGHVQPEDYQRFIDRVVETGNFEDALQEQAWDYEPSDIGAALLTHWNMPAEVIDVVKHLHHTQPHGEHDRLIQFTRLVNGLLSEQGIGLPGMDWGVEYATSYLNVDVEKAREIAADLLTRTSDIDSLVERLVMSQR
jgi:HD-like signal output (HDOD) protein